MYVLYWILRRSPSAVNSRHATSRLEHPARRRIPAAPNCRRAEASGRRHIGSFRISRGPIGAAAVRSLARAWLSTRNDARPAAQPQRCADRRPLSLSRTQGNRYGIARALPDDQRRLRHVRAERRLHAEPPREGPLLGSADRRPLFAERDPCV